MSILKKFYSKKDFLKLVNEEIVKNHLTNSFLSCLNSRPAERNIKKEQYVIFSYGKDKTEKVYLIMELLKDPPIKNLTPSEEGKLAVLLLAIHRNIETFNIHGICEIEITVENHSNDMIVREIKDSGSAFAPDLIHLTEAIKQYSTDNNFNCIKIEDNIFVQFKRTEDFTQKELFEKLNIVELPE